ncbi:universal stress protein [Salinibacterium sp. dk2585]|uniref:universal stress protein n=1 Tax=unclassified Salinibacterium TaxID=2632331 RepID=UPI0011C2555E|nr:MULTISPECIES: universal stress protein [unclassified Salinibacterium]QEE61766.1 universal stress protein [Salinibacterium sp. dk2585]TXK54679.1 universal stress protein [Salinibacterium sp. dk5596]
MTRDTDSARIVVGVDGSEESIAALRHGARLADALDAPLEAIAVWDYPLMIDPAYSANWSPEADAETILSEAVAEAFEGSPPRGLTQLVLQGSAARRLIEQSAKASMLVVGSRGHGGFAGLLLGSVSAACAAHAHCPVLIIHSPDAS